MVLFVCRSAKAWTPGLARGRHMLYPSQLKPLGKWAGKMLLPHRSQPEPSTRRWPDQQLSSVGQELLRINNLYWSPFQLVTTSEARNAVPRGASSTSAQTCHLTSKEQPLLAPRTKRPECAPCAKGCELRICGLHQFWKKWLWKGRRHYESPEWKEKKKIQCRLK